MHFMPGRKQVFLFQGRGCGDRCKRHQPCPPAQQLDGLTIRDFRRLRQSLVRMGIVQTQLASHRPPNGCLSPFWMLNQRATFDPLRESPAIGLALATLLWLEPMQLPMMPAERSQAHQPPIIRSSLPPNRALCQHPGIDAVRFPYLSQLLARFLQAQLLPQRFGFVALFGLNRSQLAQFHIEPLFAYFQRRKALIPSPFSLGASLDVFNHEDADREELTEEPSQTKFPLPACPGRWRQCFLALLSILTGLAATMAIPIGIVSGVYLSEHKGSRFASAVRFAADTLNGVPSIVIGVFAYGVVVLPLGHFSALAGGVALGIMMIPIIARTTEELLLLVPNALREGALALGATRARAVFTVVVPAALPGIITGIVLALARIAGETAPLLFTSFNNRFFTSSLRQPIASKILFAA